MPAASFSGSLSQTPFYSLETLFYSPLNVSFTRNPRGTIVSTGLIHLKRARDYLKTGHNHKMRNRLDSSDERKEKENTK